MSSYEQHTPQNESRVKKRSKSSKSKSGVTSINLAVAKGTIKSVTNWRDFAWSKPLAECLNAVAADVAHSRVPEEDCRRELLSACRFACETAEQDFDSIESDVEEVIGGAIANAHADRDEVLAQSVITPDADQPEWLPALSDFFTSGRKIYRRTTAGIRLVCSQFDVKARYVGVGHGWIVEIYGQEVLVPANIGECKPAELTSLLVANGVTTDESEDRHADLLALFKRAQPEGKIRVVNVGGWQADRKTFVLPDAAIGPGAGSDEYRIAGSSDHRFNVSGTLQEWQEQVAAPCNGNPLLVFAVCVAAAAPFAGVVPNLPGFFHIVGQTSSGKSTAGHVAGSLWGGSTSALGYGGSWNVTANSLIGRAVQHSDALMFLDELGTAKPKDVDGSVYQISMGQGRGRMVGTKSNGIENAKLERFNALIVSTGEITIEDKMREGGFTLKGGMDVRAPSIFVGEETGLPVFEDLHGEADARAFSERIGDKARNVYGAAARAYIAKVAEDHAKALARLNEIAAKWMEKHVPVDLPAEHRRTGARFAAVAAAGELATEFGITGWTKGVAFRAVARVFLHWLTARSTKPKDAMVADEKLRVLLARNDARFARLETVTIVGPHGDSSEPRWTNVANRIGVLTRIDDKDYYAVAQGVLAHELKDIAVPALLKRLAKEGVIRRGEGKNIASKVVTPEGRSRLVLIARSFVHDDCDDANEPEREPDIVDDGKEW